MKIKLLATISVLMFAGQLSAGQKVDQTLDVDDDGVVQIENIRGIVRIEGWNKGEVSVEGELDDMAEKLEFETNGRVTTIIVKMPKGRVNRGKGSNLTIKVPNQSSVEFEGVSTDVIADDVKGGIDLATVSGDIDATNIETRVSVKTVSGDLTVKNGAGVANLGTVSGDIVAQLDSREVEAAVVSGDVTLDLTEFSQLSVSSVNGDLNISGAQLSDGSTSMNTVNGDITFELTQALDARVNVNTGPGGDITNDLTADRVKDVFPNQQQLNMTVGSGNGKVVLSTVNGSIRLRY